MNVTAVPVNVLPTLSVALAWTVYEPDDQAGKDALSVHVAVVEPVVAACVVDRLVAVACHVEPLQYRLSDPRWSVNVVLLELRPVPPELSAAVPLNEAGIVAAVYTTPSAGAMTDARTGAVLSTTSVPLGPAAPALLPAVSVAVPAAMERLSVPSPVMLESVTVRDAVPVPETATKALAVPVVLSVIPVATSVTVFAPA